MLATPRIELSCLPENTGSKLRSGSKSKSPFRIADGALKPEFEVGEKVILSYTPDAPPEFQYQFADRQRRSLLLWLALLFAAAVIALGRWRGIGALAGLSAAPSGGRRAALCGAVRAGRREALG